MTPYRNPDIDRIIARAEKFLEKGYILTAINRYEGFFNSVSTCQELHTRVAILYLEIGDPLRAGKHFYFKEAPSAIEQACISEFEKSCGNSPIQLLKKLLYWRNYRLQKLDAYTRLKLRVLLDAAAEEYPVTPSFVINRSNRLAKIEAGKIELD